jgi:hypothetical protein
MEEGGVTLLRKEESRCPVTKKGGWT